MDIFQEAWHSGSCIKLACHFRNQLPWFSHAEDRSILLQPIIYRSRYCWIHGEPPKLWFLPALSGISTPDGIFIYECISWFSPDGTVSAHGASARPLRWLGFWWRSVYLATWAYEHHFGQGSQYWLAVLSRNSAIKVYWSVQSQASISWDYLGCPQLNIGSLFFFKHNNMKQLSKHKHVSDVRLADYPRQYYDFLNI